MASRGPSVKYTLSNIPNKVFGTIFLKGLCDIIILNLNEKQGIVNIWSNPEMISNPARRLPGISNANDKNAAALATSVKNNLKTNTKITPKYINDIISAENTLNAGIGSLFNNSYSAMPAQVNNTLIKGSSINNIVNNLNIVSASLDSVNSWWNPNTDICVRSCQVSCQQTCQLACQDCQGYVHDKHCGSFGK